VLLKFRNILKSFTWLQDLQGAFYKQCFINRQLRFFVYLKDLVDLTGLSIILGKSSLLAEYLSILINRHRKVFGTLQKIKQVVGIIFNRLVTGIVDLSLKVAVNGKLHGQFRRRVRKTVLIFGHRVGVSTLNKEVNYTLIQTFNLFGSFCVKVWIRNGKWLK
jgi:hypothetical protein